MPPALLLNAKTMDQVQDVLVLLYALPATRAIFTFLHSSPHCCLRCVEASAVVAHCLHHSDICVHVSLHRLEIFVGLASFTGCLVAVDKLYLFYACVFNKTMALIFPDTWEPTLRYPRRWKKGAKVPSVCVQLPMFNETFVARRVIDYACRMDYPKNKIYIQCLDDSTDPETRQVVDDGVAHWRAKGFNIEAIRRTNRQGYKAGAMHEVHDAIPCEFIAIFDADFLPETDFLLRAMPVFQVRSTAFAMPS